MCVLVSTMLLVLTRQPVGHLPTTAGGDSDDNPNADTTPHRSHHWSFSRAKAPEVKQQPDMSVQTPLHWFAPYLDASSFGAEATQLLTSMLDAKLLKPGRVKIGLLQVKRNVTLPWGVQCAPLCRSSAVKDP